MNKLPESTPDPEIAAISTVHAALKNLEPEAQSRVLVYVAGKLKVAVSGDQIRLDSVTTPAEDAVGATPPAESIEAEIGGGDGALDGVSPIAKKWMTRNGLDTGQLDRFFSLGLEEIDLIATSVPGKGKKEKMRSVFLLKGIAAYLGTGAARFTHEQMKDTCLHYDAFDAANFAANLKSLSSEVTGGKTEGYTLTARGLAAATEIVKAMTKGTAG